MATAWGVPVGVAFPAVADADASADEEDGAGEGTADVTGGGDAGDVAAQEANIRPAPIVTANRAGVRVAFTAVS
ncbi:hypothetical protein [Arthrobacter sp. ZGTC412]|uniref:hypothetical protein n=1 Tax=Arthrobacter sp. ZGTC412 TaxID=2058900 RepID=UPI0027D250C5|nr:hypothetical protein [Arthrobacter sp. ZGTC412]